MKRELRVFCDGVQVAEYAATIGGMLRAVDAARSLVSVGPADTAEIRDVTELDHGQLFFSVCEPRRFVRTQRWGTRAFELLEASDPWPSHWSSEFDSKLLWT